MRARPALMGQIGRTLTHHEVRAEFEDKSRSAIWSMDKEENFWLEIQWADPETGQEWVDRYRCIPGPGLDYCCLMERSLDDEKGEG